MAGGVSPGQALRFQKPPAIPMCSLLPTCGLRYELSAAGPVSGPAACYHATPP